MNPTALFPIRLRSMTAVGPGAVDTLRDVLAPTRLTVVVDREVSRQPAVERAMDRLAPSQIILGRSDSEPDYDYLDVIAAEARETDPDAVIGIGGGSTLDLAKGVGILLRNPGHGIDYRGQDKVETPGVPVGLAPTTAGSGSEATETASFVDRTTRTKLGINGRNVGCAAAALDPTLLTGCPARVTVGSGLDALVHAVEAVSARTANPVSRLLGCEAVRLLFGALPTAVAEPDAVEARQDTLLGAHLAGLAMQNAGGGPASGISYPLGVHFGVPHGYAGGVLLPHVVAANHTSGYSGGYALLADALRVPSFPDALFALYAKIGAPLTLDAWRIEHSDIPTLAKLTLTERVENLRLNPVEFGRAEVISLLEAVTT